MTPALVGSNPTGPVDSADVICYGLLAQVVEHLTFNQVVAGSSPAWLMILKPLKNFFDGFFVALLLLVM